MDNQPVRVLIIDDEKPIADAIARFLKTEGYAVSSSLSGADGLAAMRRRAADIVLTDIKMPGMDGLEVLRVLREEFPETDVMIISGHGQMHEAITALRLGAYDYLQKPINFTELLIVLERATQQRENRRLLYETQAQLYHTQRMEGLGVLAGGVAHEFNNLMAGIIGYANLAKNSDDRELWMRSIAVTLKGAERASDIAQNLLRFARRSRFQKQPTDINLLIHDALVLLEKDYENDGIALQTEYAQLPALRLDPGQFQQVILNLLANSRNAMQHQKERGRQILIRTSVNQTHVIIEVSDTGVGVPDELKERVFEPFFTTEGALGGGTTPHASGLGLSVVAGIIRAHGGEVICTNSPGGGATFSVTLPLPESETKAKIKIKPRILLCDDVADIRHVLRVVLEQDGFAVDEAADGEAALELIRTTDYQLLFLDQLMPGINGLEVLRQLPTTAPDLPVVMVTALKTDEIAREAIEAGARECTFKPIRSQKILFLAHKYADPKTYHEMPFADAPRVAPAEKTILVIDHDPVMCDVYSIILRNEGYRVTTFLAWEEALRETETHDYDLIIVDLSRHQHSGEKGMQALRAHNPYTPIIISANSVADDRAREGLRAGASRIMKKPVDDTRLLDEVTRLLSLYHR